MTTIVTELAWEAMIMLWRIGAYPESQDREILIDRIEDNFRKIVDIMRGESNDNSSSI